MAGAPQGPVYQVAVMETKEFEASPNPDEEMKVSGSCSSRDLLRGTVIRWATRFKTQVPDSRVPRNMAVWALLCPCRPFLRLGVMSSAPVSGMLPVFLCSAPIYIWVLCATRYQYHEAPIWASQGVTI